MLQADIVRIRYVFASLCNMGNAPLKAEHVITLDVTWDFIYSSSHGDTS